MYMRMPSAACSTAATLETSPRLLTKRQADVIWRSLPLPWLRPESLPFIRPVPEWRPPGDEPAPRPLFFRRSESSRSSVRLAGKDASARANMEVC